MKKEYIDFNSSIGWPAGGGIYYECLKCSTVVPTDRDGDCKCHNMYVDVSCGRIGANEPDKVKPFRYKK